MSSGFAGIHVHSQFSFLDGRSRTDEIAEQAKANGDESVAITDHDEVGGHLSFQKSCVKAGIKPIFGTEARWVLDIAASREAKTRGFDDSHIVLLARNEIGLHNLWALSSLAYEEANFYGKPQLHPALLREYSEGLWASDGCALTRLAEHIYRDEHDKARQELGTLQGIFGERFYMELHTWQVIHPRDDDVLKFYGEEMSSRQANALMSKINNTKVNLANEMGIPLVVVNDAHYAQQHQWEEAALVWDINTWKGDQTGNKTQTAAWMMNTDEILHWMDQFAVPRSVTQEAIKNTAMIAQDCNVEIKPTLEMPRLFDTDAEDNAAFLKAVEEGFKRKIIDKDLDFETYYDRLENEVQLIVDKGFAGYFNVVADYTLAAKTGRYMEYISGKREPCLCGPGRGSAGGSLVAYLMGITGLDPLHYDLMFERFLNPDRMDYPDIDVDFPKGKCPDVKRYLGKVYGEDKVVPIGTFSRSGIAQLIWDVGKAQGIDLGELGRIRRKIDEVSGTGYSDEEADDEEELTLADVVAASTELADMLAPHPRLVEMVMALFGTPRQSGVHAAGVICSKQPWLGNVPTRRKPGGTGTLATQFDMHELEFLGGVKNDILAIKHLDICEHARDLIYKRHGVWLDYSGEGHGVPADAYEVIAFGPEQYADPEIWQQIDKGETTGIFQIGTIGGTKQAVRFRPRSERELADLIAINRPGVIRAGQLEHYLRRRRDEEEVTFQHPMMEDITGETYGILVYQEQLLQAARELAGFTPGEAERLRKIIGKKLIDEMRALEPKFIDGCLGNYDYMYPFIDPASGSMDDEDAKKVAHRIWASLLASGQYAFNKSHAMGYSIEACWEIWTKHYYFDEFITACLAVDTAKTEKYIADVRRHDRLLLPPDINHSGAKFTLTEEGIRFGLENIQNVGEAATADILPKRQESPFRDLEDFMTRCARGGGAKKGVADALVKIGAFDYTGQPRELMLANLHYYRCAAEVAPRKLSGLTPEEIDVIVADKQAKKPTDFQIPDFYDEKKLRAMEVEMVGTFITNDPMARYHEQIDVTCIHHPVEIDGFATSQQFCIGGQITRIHEHKQRNDQMMAFITVTWREQEYELMAFADAYAANKTMLEHNAPVVCGVIKLKGSGCHLSVVHRLDWI